MPVKRKAPAKKAVSTKAAEPNPNVLQSKSSNVLKRPLNDDLAKESSEQSEPKAKRTLRSSTIKSKSDGEPDGSVHNKAKAPKKAAVSKSTTKRPTSKKVSKPKPPASEAAQSVSSTSTAAPASQPALPCDGTGEDQVSSSTSDAQMQKSVSTMPQARLPSKMTEIRRPAQGLWKDHPSQNIIESPPDWAWNLAGHWEITAPVLSQALKLGKSESLSMKIRVANNPTHAKAGRQLFASFEFGDAMKGYMRFCPASAPDVQGCSTKEFESACKLEEGQWAGPSEKGGQEKWFWRWRGKNGFMSWEDGSDQFQDEVNFTRGPDGEYKMEAVFTYHYRKMLVEAVKVKESTPPRGSVTSVASLWDGCRTKKAGGGSRYIVSAGYGLY